jgi:hypothetical protein
LYAVILPITVPEVARIIGLSHHTRLDLQPLMFQVFLTYDWICMLLLCPYTPADKSGRSSSFIVWMCHISLSLEGINKLDNRVSKIVGTLFWFM